MGRYFDFTPVKPWAGGLGDLFEGIGAGAEAVGQGYAERKKLDMEKVRADAYKAQTDAQTKAIDRGEARDKVTFEQGQQDRRAKAIDAIGKYLGTNQFGAAESAAAGSQFVNPQTGRMEGISLTRDAVAPVPADAAPVMPEAPAKPAAPFVGPIEPPEEARARGMAEVLGKRTQPPALGSPEEQAAKAAGDAAAGQAQQLQTGRARSIDEQLQYDINKSTYDRQAAGAGVEDAAYQAVKEKHDQDVAHPKFTLGMPGGQQVRFDPEEAKLAQTAEAQKTAAVLRRQAASPDIPNEVRLQMLTTANTIEAELKAAAAGAVTNATSQSSAHAFTGGQNAANRQTQREIATGHDRAHIRAAEIRGPDKGGLYPDKDQRPVIKELEDNIADIRRKGGLQEQITHMERSLSAVEKNPRNTTNWIGMVDGMIRTATGKAAIMNQYALYTGHAAGSLDDAVNQLQERLMTGGLSDDQKASLYSAAQDSYNEVSEEYNQAYDTAHEYDTDPRVTGNQGVKLGVDRTLHNTFRGGKRKPRTATSVPGSPAKALPGAPAAPPPGAAPAASAVKPAAAHAVGETRVIDGITYVKDGPNHWSKQMGPPAP